MPGSLSLTDKYWVWREGDGKEGPIISFTRALSSCRVKYVDLPPSLVNDPNLEESPILFRTISLANLITLSPTSEILRFHSPGLTVLERLDGRELVARGAPSLSLDGILNNDTPVIVGRMEGIVPRHPTVVPSLHLIVRALLPRGTGCVIRSGKTMLHQITAVLNNNSRVARAFVNDNVDTTFSACPSFVYQ